jgi:hypothetical protein
MITKNFVSTEIKCATRAQILRKKDSSAIMRARLHLRREVYRYSSVRRKDRGSLRSPLRTYPSTIFSQRRWPVVDFAKYRTASVGRRERLADHPMIMKIPHRIRGKSFAGGKSFAIMAHCSAPPPTAGSPGPRRSRSSQAPHPMPSFEGACTRDRLCRQCRRVAVSGGGPRGILADQPAAAIRRRTGARPPGRRHGQD